MSGRGEIAPTQTLSFLFSDLRDYTSFVEERGDVSAAELIAEYRRIVRQSVAESNGTEIKTEGDSFYVVFRSASAALTGALAILEATERRMMERGDLPLRVGIGIHVGEAVPQDGQYVGSAVNIAARLAEAAGPGELMVSETVRTVLRTTSTPPMREMFGAVLKGLEDSPRVFEVVWRTGPKPDRSDRRSLPPEAIRMLAAGERPRGRRILCPTLIGRREETDVLLSLARDSRNGQGQTALVSGEAGVGKTALVVKVTQTLSREGVTYWTGRCSTIETSKPFGPFLQILAEARGGDLADLSSGAPTRLAALVPDATGRNRIRPAARPHEIYDAVAAALTDLSRRGPQVMVVEDLQWADDATIELFEILARRIRKLAIFLIGTYRVDEPLRPDALGHLVARLVRSRIVEEIDLRRLRADQTSDMIKASLGLDEGPDPTFAAAIHARCDGNPFFVEEVLRSLVEGGQLSYETGVWRSRDIGADVAVPSTVLEIVRERLAMLSPNGVRLLQIAAVIGQEFRFDVLERAAGTSETSLVDELHGAIDAQLLELRRGRAGAERYSFRHALTREAIHSTLLSPERRAMHRVVGQAFEAVAGRDASPYAEELAYHFEQAGSTAKARRYHDLAAREAEKVSAFGRAVDHLERAIALSDASSAGLADLYLRLADAATPSDDTERVLRAAGAAADLYKSRGEGRRAGAALTRIAHANWFRGRSDEARRTVLEAIGLLELTGPSAELAAACAEVARLDMLDDRGTSAERWAERAVAIAREAQDKETLADALVTYGSTLAFADATVAKAVPILQEALELGLSQSLPGPTQRAYNNLPIALLVAGATKAEVRPIFDEHTRHDDRFGVRSEGATYRRFYYALTDGDWETARRIRQEAPRDTIWSAGRDLGAALMRTATDGPPLGRLSVAKPHEKLIAAGDTQWIALAGGFASTTALVAERWSDCLSYAEPIAGLLGNDYWAAGVSAAAVAAMTAARSAGLSEDLARWISLSSTSIRNRLALLARGRRAFASALTCERSGDLSAAISASDEAIRFLSEDPEFSFVVTWAYLLRADLRASQGETPEAAADVTAAAAFWRRAGAHWYLGRIFEWARMRGLTAA